MSSTIIRICLTATLVLFTFNVAGGVSPPPRKPLCEVVALAELVVIGEQTKCIVPDIEGPEPPGPISTVDFLVHETILGAQPIKETITVNIYCLEEERAYILMLRRISDKHPYVRAYGFNDILRIERKEQVLECIEKNQE